MKKFFGALLILLGILMILAFVGRLGAFLTSFFGLVAIFSGELEGYEIGYRIGRFLYWIVHIAIIVFSIRYGRRLWKGNVESESEL